MKIFNSSTQNILDVAPQGGTGVSGSTEGRTVKAERRPFNVEAKTGVGVFEASPVILSENQASPADSQFQGRTIERLVDAVFRAEEHAEQSRLEEIEAEREGGDTAASGYPEPMYERNGR